MANQLIIIKSVAELEKYKCLIKETSEKTVSNIHNLLNDYDNESFLYQIKFNKVGYEPILGHKLNLIEQINQMFSYIVSLKAVEILLNIYTDTQRLI